MKGSRMICVSFLLAVAALAQAQAWADSYDKALGALRLQNWPAARAAFLEAVQSRPLDTARGTTLPTSVTERKQWRGGSPYSANFGAAYAGLKQAFAIRDDAERGALLRQVATEFENLLAKKQSSKESFYFLNIAYSTLGDKEGQEKLEAQFQKNRRKLTWKIDPELVGPEDMAAIEELARVDMNSTRGSAAIELQNPTNTTPKNEGSKKEPSPPAEPKPRQNPTNPANPTLTVPPKKNPVKKTDDPNTIDPATLTPGGDTSGVAGKVPTLQTKFALIIANSEGKIPEIPAPDFAVNDARLLKETLVTSCGYAEENVVILENVGAGQIDSSAKALAEKVPEDGVVLIYFIGAGVNIDGKDFLAGVDTTSATDSGTMLPKQTLFQPFVQKGARIFSFFESNRPIVNGRWFGGEAPLAGTIAQVQATIPGGSLFTVIKNGKPVGVFTNAFSNVLTDFKSNRVPILEFSWQVFYRMRRGNTGGEGGGSSQTPTLPLLTNIASDAKF